MNKTIQIYRKLNKLPLFTTVDKLQARKISAKNALFINGYWRSGTTFFMEYLEELLNRRTFFEPLHYSVKQSQNLHVPMGFKIEGRDVMQCYPFVFPQAKHTDNDEFYEAMLRGEISTPWTRRNRKITSYLQKDVIVKSVRANFIAPYLMHRFGVKNIFIIRHPAAVLASIIRKGNGAPSIYKTTGSDRFIELLLSEIEKNLSTEIIKNLRKTVDRYKGEHLNNVILSWCLCNYLPLKFMEDGYYKPLLINYESFFLDDNTKTKLCNYLSIKRSNIEIDFNSSTTKKGRKRIPIYDRLYSWQNDLSSKQINLVYDISSSFGEEIKKVINIAEQNK